MAAVPVPLTQTAGGVITAATLNSYRDALAFLQSPPRCILTKTSQQTLSTVGGAPLTWDTEVLDTVAMHSTVSNTSRVTAVYPGWYRVLCTVVFAPNATGARAVVIRRNGSTAAGDELGYVDAAPSGTATNGTAISTAASVYLAVGDYVESVVYQFSGGNLDTSALHGGSRLEVIWSAL